MESQPNLSNFSDRQQGVYASSRATAALSVADDLASRWNTLVAGNRYLIGELDRLKAVVAELRATVELLVELALNRADPQVSTGETIPVSELSS